MAATATIGAEPARIDIDVNAGEPVDFTIPVYDSAGALQDVSAWTATAPVRQDPGSPVLASLTTTLSAAGVRVRATAAATAAWAAWPPVVRWNLWLTPPASDPDVLAAGWVRVRTTV